MRVIEERILNCLNAGKVGQHKLSKRDEVRIYDDEIRVILWGTCIFTKSSKGRFYYFSSRAGEAGCMSATTASRISALQYHYGDVAVGRKNYAHYSWKDKSPIKTDVWYKADDTSPSGYVEVQHD